MRFLGPGCGTIHWPYALSEPKLVAITLWQEQISFSPAFSSVVALRFTEKTSSIHFASHWVEPSWTLRCDVSMITQLWSTKDWPIRATESERRRIDFDWSKDVILDSGRIWIEERSGGLKYPWAYRIAGIPECYNLGVAWSDRIAWRSHTKVSWRQYARLFHRVYLEMVHGVPILVDMMCSYSQKEADVRISNLLYTYQSPAS
jgi:hypothetical protein